MAFDTRLTCTDQEQLCPLVPQLGRRRVPGSPSVRPSGRQCRGALSQGTPPHPPARKHSEYSSVDFSHLGREMRAGGRGPTIQCFKASRLTCVICISASALRMLREAARTDEAGCWGHRAAGPARVLARGWPCGWASLRRPPSTDPHSGVPGRLQECVPRSHS